MFTGSLPKYVKHRNLALDRQKLAGQVPLARFSRLSEYLTSNEGDVSIRLEFRKSRKHRTLVVGSAEAEVMLACQNCLQPMTLKLSAQMRHLIVPTEEALLKLEPEEEGIVCSEDEISLEAIVEDELIVSLPMVARHAEGECAPTEGDFKVPDEGNIEAEVEKDSGTYKPFAGLAQYKDDLTRS